ncbi:MAG TPA: hypothetical protein PLW14_00950 [Chlorobiota bacterium]|nr:hypothetical protein [Chlorobiota bacterium]
MTRTSPICPLPRTSTLLRRCVTVVVALFVFGYTAHSQTVQSGNVDDFPDHDSLALKEEWWLGFNAYGMYSTGFGTLTTTYVGGELEGEPGINATTQGGVGYGIGLGAMLEYRPYQDPLGYSLTIGGEWRTFQSESSSPVGDGNASYNAIFESNATAIYLVVMPSVRYQITEAGGFVSVGGLLELPLTKTDSYLWQHEVSNGELPEGRPGEQQTSIKFRTDVPLSMRFGGQISIGHDFLVGLFGYTGQILAPYLSLSAGTAVVSTPTSFNGLHLRAGIQWRSGM